ncbi:MAG: SGNH/GDSL hydrolase family protein [Pseudomonadota bacterium]
MKSMLFWMTLPVMLPQAVALRRSAPRFASAAGPTEGSVGSGRDVRLLAIGDSIVAGVGARLLSRALVGQTALALAERGDVRVQWQAIGKSGMTAGRFIETRLDRLPRQAPDYVIVSLGVNDVTSLSTVTRWRRNLCTLFETLADRYPGTLVAFAGMPPLSGFPLLPQPLRAWVGMRGRIFDRASAEVAGDYDFVEHVPLEFDTDPAAFADDGFHPNEDSYAIYGSEMAAAISRFRPPISGTGLDSSLSSA